MKFCLWRLGRLYFVQSFLTGLTIILCAFTCTDLWLAFLSTLSSRTVFRLSGLVVRRLADKVNAAKVYIVTPASRTHVMALLLNATLAILLAADLFNLILFESAQARIDGFKMLGALVFYFLEPCSHLLR